VTVNLFIINYLRYIFCNILFIKYFSPQLRALLRERIHHLLRQLLYARSHLLFWYNDIDVFDNLVCLVGISKDYPGGFNAVSGRTL